MRTWNVSPYRRPVRPVHGNRVNRQELREEVKVFAAPPPSPNKRGALLSRIKPPPLWDHTDHLLPTPAGKGRGPRNLHSPMCQLPRTTDRWSLGKKGKEPRRKGAPADFEEVGERVVYTKHRTPQHVLLQRLPCLSASVPIRLAPSRSPSRTSPTLTLGLFIRTNPLIRLVPRPAGLCPTAQTHRSPALFPATRDPPYP